MSSNYTLETDNLKIFNSSEVGAAAERLAVADLEKASTIGVAYDAARAAYEAAKEELTQANLAVKVARKAWQTESRRHEAAESKARVSAFIRQPRQRYFVYEGKRAQTEQEAQASELQKRWARV